MLVDQGEKRLLVVKGSPEDAGFICNCMWVVGPVSSVFDFLMFCILRKLFGAGEQLFHTGWFIESIATQVLVIFVILPVLVLGYLAAAEWVRRWLYRHFAVR